MKIEIEPGDRVRDPLDDGRIREVLFVDPLGDVYMADGGVMGIDEITEVFLPSEEIE